MKSARRADGKAAGLTGVSGALFLAGAGIFTSEMHYDKLALNTSIYLKP
jgi:hypothetical protein